jgi:hypothetical protein
MMELSVIGNRSEDCWGGLGNTIEDVVVGVRYRPL